MASGELDLEGFRKRVEWVKESRFDSAKAYSLAAGLSQAHVGMIIRGDVGAGVTTDVVSKLAVAGRVRFEWLWSGNGPRDRDLTDDELPGLPPEQVAAVKWAYAAGMSAEKLERLKRSQKVARSWTEWLDIARGMLLEPDPEPEETPLQPEELPKGRR